MPSAMHAMSIHLVYSHRRIRSTGRQIGFSIVLRSGKGEKESIGIINLLFSLSLLRIQKDASLPFTSPSIPTSSFNTNNQRPTASDFTFPAKTVKNDYVLNPANFRTCRHSPFSQRPHITRPSFPPTNTTPEESIAIDRQLASGRFHDRCSPSPKLQILRSAERPRR